MRQRIEKSIVLLTLVLSFLGCVIAIIVTCSGCGFITHYVGNKVDYIHEKIDEATNYDTLKEVEDTCRSMIASYEADKLMWEQYKDSESSEQKSWADQAKIRANRTASNYNNYILKNSYVWKNNVPDDIYGKLEVLK